MTPQLRRTLITLGLELVAEVVAVSLWLVNAFLRGQAFPFAELVASSIVLLVALGCLIVTYADFWINDRHWNAATVLGVIMGIGIVGLVGVGFQLVGQEVPVHTLRAWFATQVSSALLAILYCAVARAV